MIGVVAGAVLRSRTGVAVLAVAGVALVLFTWHRVDRSSAVRRAVAEYVADVELGTARARLEELKRRRVVADRANRTLVQQIRQAEAEADAATQELESYVSTVDDSCHVGGGILERLRNR